MKTNLSDLAIFGGTPAFENTLHVGSPNIGDRKLLMKRINDLLDRKWLTNDGLFVQEFEHRISKLLGVKHCIATCNGTIALEIAIRAAGLTGEVIIPSFTFIATAHSLQWQEITPVFCDSSKEQLTIDVSKIEALITPRTTGIIGVHLWGRPCNIDVLKDIAEKHKLKLLFDASHAFSCTYKGKMIGNFGLAEVFSFHATKFINSFEGGAVVTNNDEFAEKIRLMRNFGFADYDDVIYIGTNGKMNEISAAMGITSLESLDNFVSVNKANYQKYKKELMNIPGIKLLQYNNKDKANYQFIVVLVEEEMFQLSRDDLYHILKTENIFARRYFYPGCHKMEPYRSYFPHAGLLLPQTEKLLEQVLCLPTGTAIHEKNILKICKVIRYIANNASFIREKLSIPKL
ncbi:MAG: aminotransferase class I/II-fold pyridoxal phosphate-dependent enzyme [Nitrospinales bacterium]